MDDDLLGRLGRDTSVIILGLQFHLDDISDLGAFFKFLGVFDGYVPLGIIPRQFVFAILFHQFLPVIPVSPFGGLDLGFSFGGQLVLAQKLPDGLIDDVFHQIEFGSAGNDIELGPDLLAPFAVVLLVGRGQSGFDDLDHFFFGDPFFIGDLHYRAAEFTEPAAQRFAFLLLHFFSCHLVCIANS